MVVITSVTILLSFTGVLLNVGNNLYVHIVLRYVDCELHCVQHTLL